MREPQRYKNTKIQKCKELKYRNTKKYQDVERGRSYEATMKYGNKKEWPREGKKLVVGVKHSLDASATSLFCPKTLQISAAIHPGFVRLAQLNKFHLLLFTFLLPIDLRQ